MRISDWSSDVCSSDLKGFRQEDAHRIEAARRHRPFSDVADLGERAQLDARAQAPLADAGALRGLAGDRHRARWEVAGVQKDRNCVVEGKRGSVRVDLGGRCIIKKKKTISRNDK